VVFGLKRPSVSVQNLFFAQPAIAAAIFKNWHWNYAPKCSPSSFNAIFHTTGLLSLPQSEIRARKLIVDPGHLQEEQVGVTPHHYYRRAHRHHPVVDTALKTTHILLMTKTIASLK